MMYIAICDDEVRVGADLERTLIDILDKLNIKYDIDVFFTGNELCRELEAGTHYDLIFLDIEFAQDEINGIELGQIIRDAHHNYTVSIIYISWKKEYAIQLFDIRPLNFLIKPLQYEKIKQTINTYLKVASFLLGEFSYNVGRDIFKVQIKDIVYLESYDRKLILHLADGRKEEFYGSLKEAYQEQLNKFDFLYIHASYLVNYDYITLIKYDQLLLANSAIPLPISQPKRKEVRKAYCAIMEKRK